MNDTGIWWIGMAFGALALFPFFVYVFFWLVVLEKKSRSLVDDLNSRGAFQNTTITSQWKSADNVDTEIRERYSHKRFAWPVGLMVFFYVICFSIVWDLVRYRFFYPTENSGMFYGSKFLCAAELPMMAFVGVVIFNYGHMLRRLYVWDVTTHVFWNALQRTWLVLGVAAMLTISLKLSSHENGATTTSAWMGPHVMFFALGFIVNSVLQSMMQRAQDYFQSKRTKVDDLPLSLIQGMSFWHEYRLEEEGIENVQNLATCEIVDLALTTRYNLRTLLDWVDQALLIHRMGPKAIKLRETGFISGAIDMAWASPANSDKEMAKQVAKTLETDQLYVEKLMDSLFEDEQVMMLWDLWQSKTDAWKKNGK